MRSRRSVLLAAVMAIALLGAACSSDDPDATGAVEPSASPTPTPDPTCPLTGQDPPGKVKLDRPAIAVKVENDPAARPQSGLERADVVFEERVEGGITRFMAIFHCGDADVVGSVRSGRFDDPKIALPFTSLIAASGSNQTVTNEMTERGILYLTESTTDGLFRDSTLGSGVHGLFANSKILRKAAVEGDLKPPKEGIFTFGEIANKAKKAATVSMNFTPSNTIEYRWENNGWARYEAGVPFMTRAGAQLSVPNVLVQLVQVDNGTIVDVAGNPSTDITMVGTGKVLLFRDGKVIKGTWEIKKEGGAPTFTDKTGEPLVFAEGPIWIELIPNKDGEVEGAVAFSKKLTP
ncbi:MAG: DUF3048 domain-containing protein [Actinobacteria bacterium]|nr:DUF3048 domain-containing protein [Actinomycetota bacterium]